MLFISIVAFIIFPILSIPYNIQSLLIDYKNKYSIIYVFMISVGISVVSYYIVQPSGNDIHNYHNIMKIMNNMSYLEAYKYFDEFSIMPIIYSVFYIISKVENLNLISSISAFTVYSILFYIVYDYSKTINSKRSYIVISLVLTFLITNFITVISGIRFHIAYALFLLGVYNETIKNRKKVYSIILYICSCLIHTSMYYMIIVIISYKIYNMTKSKLRKKIICLIVLFWNLLDEILINVLNIITGGIMSSYIDSKINVYSTIYSIGNINAKLILFAQNSFFILFVLILARKIIKKYNKNTIEYWKFLNIFAIFLIGCIGDDILFNRLGQIFRVICIPGILLYLNNCKYKLKPLNIYIILMYIFFSLYLQQSMFKLEFSTPLVNILIKNLLNVF